MVILVSMLRCVSQTCTSLLQTSSDTLIRVFCPSVYFFVCIEDLCRETRVFVFFYASTLNRYLPSQVCLVLESWPSGLRRRFGEPVYSNVSWVRIPHFPHSFFHGSLLYGGEHHCDLDVAFCVQSRWFPVDRGFAGGLAEWSKAAAY